MALRCVWVVLSASSTRATLACASGTSVVQIGMDINDIAAHPNVSSFSMDGSSLEVIFNLGGCNTFLRWLADNQPEVEVPDGYQPVQATILWPELPFPKEKESSNVGEKGRIIHL